MPRLYKRGRTWYSDIVINGERIRKPLDTDKGFAEERLSKLIEERNAHRFKRIPTAVDWPTFKARFLKFAGSLAKNTWYQYNRAIRELEKYRTIHELSDITPVLLVELYTHWKATRPLYVRNRDIQSLKAMMHRAEEWELIGKRDWLCVKRDKEPKGRLLWYTVREFRRLLRSCHGVWHTIARLGFRTGLRRGEIHSLPWDHVDFARKRLHIAPFQGWNPKDHERRWIPMPQDLVDYLRGLPRRGEYVLGTDRPTLGSMSIYFKRIVLGAGLRGSLHTLRHSYGSHLASNGASPKQIKEVMGHSKLEMTDRYLHLAPDSQQGIVKHLPDL